MLEGLFGSKPKNYYINTSKGLAASNTKDGGGIGTYGYVQDATGNYVGMDENAYNTAKEAGVQNLYTSDQMNDIAARSGAGSTTGPTGFMGTLGTAGSVMQGLGGLAGAYTGYKNYQLAKDQFDYEKALSGVNLANQGKLVNNQIMNAAEVSNALAGGTLTDAQKQSGLAAAQNRFVRTSI